MSYSKLVIKAALATIAGLGIATTSWAAGSAQSNLGVSGSVLSVCTISTTAVAFGPYDGITANAVTALPATGAVSLKCTKGSSATVNIGLNLGVQPAGSVRRMKDGGSNLLTYELYQPNGTLTTSTCAAAPIQIWGTSGSALFTPSAPAWGLTAQSFAVCGLVPAGQDAVAGGGYVDTVIATVNF